MSKVTINVKDDQGKVIKTYDMDLVDSETVQEFYEEARRVWSEYYVELETSTTTLSKDFTYEQEMMMLTEHEQYRQFLMMSPI
jgi:hypothetical protein